MKTLALVAVLALFGSCTTIYNGNSASNVNNLGPSGVISPSPGSTGGGLVASVKVAEFGENCPSGLSPAESIPRQVRKGCTSAITCSPKDAQGKELPQATPPHLDRFIVVSGAQYVVDTEQSNPFNHDVFGKEAGIALFICTVEGVSSEPWPLEIVN